MKLAEAGMTARDRSLQRPQQLRPEWFRGLNEPSVSEGSEARSGVVQAERAERQRGEARSGAERERQRGAG